MILILQDQYWMHLNKNKVAHVPIVSDVGYALRELLQMLDEEREAQSAERELVGRLRQIRATGRVVIEFKPNSSGAFTIPEIPL